MLLPYWVPIACEGVSNQKASDPALQPFCAHLLCNERACIQLVSQFIGIKAFRGENDPLVGAKEAGTYREALEFLARATHH